MKLAILYFLLFITGCATINSNVSDEKSVDELTPTNIDYIKYKLYIYNSGSWTSKDNQEMTISEFNSFLSKCGKGFGEITNSNVHKFHHSLERCGSNYSFSFQSCNKP